MQSTFAVDWALKNNYLSLCNQDKTECGCYLHQYMDKITNQNDVCDYRVWNFKGDNRSISRLCKKLSCWLFLRYYSCWLVGFFSDTIHVGFFSDTIQVRSFQLCLMITSINLYTFMPVLVAFITEEFLKSDSFLF